MRLSFLLLFLWCMGILPCLAQTETSGGGGGPITVPPPPPLEMKLEGKIIENMKYRWDDCKIKGKKPYSLKEVYELFNPKKIVLDPKQIITENLEKNQEACQKNSVKAENAIDQYNCLVTEAVSAQLQQLLNLSLVDNYFRSYDMSEEEIKDMKKFFIDHLKK